MKKITKYLIISIFLVFFIGSLSTVCSAEYNANNSINMVDVDNVNNLIKQANGSGSCSPNNILTIHSNSNIQGHDINNSLDNHNMHCKTSVYHLQNQMNYNENLQNQMNYNEIMHYLLKGNTPTYILVNGNISNLRHCTFLISDKLPNGYHNLSDNYHGLSLTNERFKGTLFYCPNDYKLKTVFITDDMSEISLTEYSIFMRNVRNTQYLSMAPLQIPSMNISRDELIKIIDGDPFSGPKQIELMVKKLLLSLNDTIQNYRSEADKIYAHNLVVAKARGDNTGRYWGMGHYLQFADVDDNQLEILNMYYQDAKYPLKIAINAIDKSILEFEDSILALEWAKLLIPSDFGFDKPITTCILSIKTMELVVKYAKFDLECKFTELDVGTYQISSEKSYRALIRSGLVVPETPNAATIEEYNTLIDEKIQNLTKIKENEYSRIFQTTIYDIQSNASNMMDYYMNQIQWLNKTGNLNIENLNTLLGLYQFFEDIYNSADEKIEELNLEKEIYPYFSQEVDDLIQALSTLKISSL